MKNIYWAVKYDNGWFNSHAHATRRKALEAYLDYFKGGSAANKTWAWHKRKYKVSLVKVHFVEVPNE